MIYTRLLFGSTMLVGGLFSYGAEKTFNIGKSADTQINWRGTPIVSSEEISFYPGEKLSDKSEKTVIRKVKNWRTINTWSSNKHLAFRKEVAVSNDGKEIELNFRANRPSYHQKKGIRSFAYAIKLPIAPFIGMNYIAFYDRTSRVKIAKGILTDKSPNKSLLRTKIRYLVFEGKGRRIVFDFNPEGVQTFGDYGSSTILGLWRVVKTPTHLKFSFGIGNTEHGGAISSKIRIFEGTAADYLKRHAYRKYSYYSELPVEKAFCFGAAKHGKAFTDAALHKYSPSTGFGWINPTGIKLDSERKLGSIFTAATGSGNKVFRCDLKRSGLYIFTLRSAGYKNLRGAFSLIANRKKIFSNLKISPYTLKNISWSQWVENGKIELAFSGRDWAVSSIGIQMLQHTFEDYKFRRGFWIAENLFEPHPLNTSACFSKPVKHDISITQIALPQKPITDPAIIPVIPPGKVLLPNQNASAMRWRYNAIIGTLGPSNHGTFTEFPTSKLIKRRLEQIKKNGINSILINGFLSRHTFPTQLKRVEKNIKDIAAAGHKLNMKIMDHQDLSLLWNMGSGFRVMCEKLGMTQRTIDANLPNRGFCLTNKNFSDFYFKWISRFIKDTDIDGIMIDETCYHGLNFCGCVDCRKKFTTDTGLTLPFDETSPLLQNKNSKLWKTWLSWRIKATADWSVKLRRRVMPFKPNFTIMRYTTHYGFTSTYASLHHGATLSGAARSCDFLGTEIMSRNVMASHRAVFVFRKAKNALREAFGSPIFGLVYPLQSPNFAYFGWAMNNMNAQATWIISRRQNNNDTYTGFKENMNRRLARPVSNIGVFFSTQSRDWAKFIAVIPEVMGVSQALTDRHIMHDFFMERSISDKFLKKYRAVILPSSCCISRKHIQTFLKYARDGGTLYLTSSAGLLDQLGNLYSSWPFADVLGINLLKNKVKFSKTAKIAFTGQTPVEFNKKVLRIMLNKNSSAKIIANALNVKGKAFQPLALEVKYGKGRIIYCASQLSGYNYERENTYGRKWIYAMNKPLDNFNGQMLAKVIGTKKLDFTPVNIPLQVLTSVYRQTDKGKSSTMVHLLNATGVKRLEIGKTIPGEIPEPAWPALSKELVFEISLPSLKQAYAVSPDYKGHRPVKIQNLGKNRYRITISKNLLKKYSIIFMEH